MEPGEIIRSLLIADTAVAALVSSRVYPQIMPQPPALPAIVYQVISDTPVTSLQGETYGAGSALTQVDCYATTYAQAQALANAVEAVLKSYTTQTVSSLRRSRRDLYENETKLHRVSSEFIIWSIDP